MKKFQVEELDFKNISIVVLTHKRTSHLLSVLSSLEASEGFHSCRLIFACDRPSPQVRSIVQAFSHAHKTIIVNERDPSSVAQAINLNLFMGVNEAFRNTASQIVVVLEDDIVVSPDFLVFALEIFRNYSKNSFFRGLNLFSRMVPDGPNSNSYVIGNFGLGWGWAINRTTFEKFCKFWNGREDNHWDFIVEPFCRTGFVVNPMRSRIRNIGIDETASHTIGESAKLLAAEIERSSNATGSRYGNLTLSDQRFHWEANYFQFRRTRLMAWISTLTLAKFIFILYGCHTGKNKVTIKLYDILRKSYIFLGKKCSQ